MDKITVLPRSTALSVTAKRQLSKDSEFQLKWEDLDSRDRRIIMAMTFEGSVEEARKSLKASIGGFYKRWKYLKPIYNSLLGDFPRLAVDILKVGAPQAAKVLVNNLGAENPADQIKAANSVLDRITPKRDQIQIQMQQGLKPKLTVEAFFFGETSETGDTLNQENGPGT